MWVYPANQEAELPDVFKEHAQVPDAPTQLTPEEIDAGREHWIQAWTEVVLR